MRRFAQLSADYEEDDALDRVPTYKLCIGNLVVVVYSEMKGFSIFKIYYATDA